VPDVVKVNGVANSAMKAATPWWTQIPAVMVGVLAAANDKGTIGGTNWTYVSG
jgi:hypothetical protein